MFEVVEFRICDCDYEDCLGEKETVHFEHERVEECRDWILRYSLNFFATNELIDNKNRIDIIGMLPSGRKFTRKFRIQEITTSFLKSKNNSQQKQVKQVPCGDVGLSDSSTESKTSPDNADISQNLKKESQHGD